MEFGERQYPVIVYSLADFAKYFPAMPGGDILGGIAQSRKYISKLVNKLCAGFAPPKNPAAHPCHPGRPTGLRTPTAAKGRFFHR